MGHQGKKTEKHVWYLTATRGQPNGYETTSRDTLHYDSLNILPGIDVIKINDQEKSRENLHSSRGDWNKNITHEKSNKVKWKRKKDEWIGRNERRWKMKKDEWIWRNERRRKMSERWRNKRRCETKKDEWLWKKWKAKKDGERWRKWKTVKLRDEER